MTNGRQAGGGDPAEDEEGSVGAALSRFSPLVRQWFGASFPAPTPAQTGAWAAIGAGDHTLVVAPTGSGKTLAAFLSAIDELVIAPAGAPADRRPSGAAASCTCRRSRPWRSTWSATSARRSPAFAALARSRGLALPEIDGRGPVRGYLGGDRRAFARYGADILITTPESLFLLLTSRAREMLGGVDTVIVDEVHAVAATKRGAHLAVSLDRLDAAAGPAGPADRSVRHRPPRSRRSRGSWPAVVRSPWWRRRPPSRSTSTSSCRCRTWPRSVPRPAISPVRGSATRHASSIWPHVEERIVDLIESHRSTIVFANSRRLAERLTARLNEIHAERLEPGVRPRGSRMRAGPPAQIMAQSGASPRRRRRFWPGRTTGRCPGSSGSLIEDDLKTGRLPAVVATSSLELGVDMGAVDLVIQVEAPPTVAIRTAADRPGRPPGRRRRATG